MIMVAEYINVTEAQNGIILIAARFNGAQLRIPLKTHGTILSMMFRDGGGVKMIP